MSHSRRSFLQPALDAGSLGYWVVEEGVWTSLDEDLRLARTGKSRENHVAFVWRRPRY